MNSLWVMELQIEFTYNAIKTPVYSETKIQYLCLKCHIGFKWKSFCLLEADQRAFLSNTIHLELQWVSRAEL